MTNSHLQSALSELLKAGALNLPTVATIEEAVNGHVWVGRKKDGFQWELKKNGNTSYNVMC